MKLKPAKQIKFNVWERGEPDSPLTRDRAISYRQC